MEQRAVQRVALDSCVVIDLIEQRARAGRIRASLRGKPVRLVLCDVVLGEVQRVRGLAPADVVSRISRIVGKGVEVAQTDDGQRALAGSVTAQYRFCHGGDNLILALCRARAYVLLTFDRMLLRACEFAGVAAFHPSAAGGI